MTKRLFAAFIAAFFLVLSAGCVEEEGDDCCECVCTGTACDSDVYIVHPDGEKCKKACTDHCSAYSCNLQSYDDC